MRIILAWLLMAWPAFAGAGFFQWTPPQTQGLSWWMDGDMGVTLTTTNTVSAWADQSGNGRNASQSTNSAQPNITNNVAGNHIALVFDGVNDCMPTLATNRAIVSTDLTNMTFVIVGMSTNSANNLVIATDGTLNTRYLTIYYGYSDGNSYFDTANTSTARLSGSLNFNGAISVSVWLRGGTNMQVFKNNTVALVKAGASGAMAGDSIETIGSAAATSGNFLNGKLLRILCFNRALTGAEVTNISRINGLRYGITVP